ncbi:MAG TPA: YggS family pyridoxal phosphate-dependent enzyme [Actinomycetota bacterium]|nr:YggS family pyridoxal phosphate-dependent enzyme [Actinomycetota bacterium]
MNVASNLAAVRARIEAAARRAGRGRDDVCLVAVGKTWPPGALQEALDAGVRDLGENRAQELRDKVAALGDRARWHFIGHLQTNKVRHVVGVAHLVHSVDRVELARAVSRRAAGLGVEQAVLIEVNVAGEASKHGVAPEDAVELAAEVAALDRVRVRGLMTVAPWPDRAEDSRPVYAELARIGRAVAASVPGATELSMGMTRDFEVAVEEGATIVRVGEAIFGRRARP